MYACVWGGVTWEGSSAGRQTEVSEFTLMRFIFSSLKEELLAAGSISPAFIEAGEPDFFMMLVMASLVHSSS